ncbi:putative aldo-keto reductase [Apodospora peruviana]|uniref:Aldo-keto reductase n=1 Tax=Apodospora peruviana TaxID=516989 RepID=A0AAE0HU00_9PEZI|nr:putative aldo-keto reductase [Apodospora peruviana]
MALSLQSTTTAPGGKSSIRIPRLGLGVYQIAQSNCISACKTAFGEGYRLIDTAQLYRNEEQVGAAIRECGLDRADIFVTTKQGVRGETPKATYDFAIESIKSISGFGGYIDLFLIHVPWIRGEAEGRREIWQVMERLLDEGKVKAIGVSNYDVEHLEEMKAYAKVWPPAVNQIELHPWRQQRGLVAYCEKNGIVLQAYSPLAEGAKMDDPVLRTVADKHGKTPAQVLIRYGLQKDWVVLPKSEKAERIKENADVFGFELDEQDMRTLDGLDEGMA